MDTLPFPGFRSVSRLLLCVLMLVLAPGSVRDSQAATHREVEVAWGELPLYVIGEKVMIATLSGVFVEGAVTSVDSGAMLMDVARTSDGSRIGKGLQKLPRDIISVVQVRTVEGSGRALGAAIGGAAGTAGGWGIAEGVFHTSGEGQGVLQEPEGVVSVLGIGAAGAAVGYLLGRDRDTTITYLKIRP
jgi:hypothetical protein